MEHYCSKCLVNRVEHEGDVCATCGGTEGTGRGPNFQYSTIQNSSPPTQGRVNVTSRRRLMGSAPPQTTAPVVSSSDAGPARSNYSEPADEEDTSTSPQKKGQDSRSGVIQNFSEGPDERTFLDRILDSLLLGVSYNGRNNLVMTEFQLYQNWNSGYSTSSAAPQATRVVYYGKIAQGRPVENNDITVYGVFDHKNNYFIAERIMNQTDGTYANFVPQKTPAALIRALTVGLLLAIAAFVFALFSDGVGTGTRAGGGFQQILLGLIVTVAGVAVVICSRSVRQSRIKFPMIAMGALLVFLGIFIMTVQDLEGRLSLFKTEVISAVVTVIVLRVGASLLLGAISRPNPTVEKILNWVTVILFVLIIGSIAISVFLA